MNAEKSRCDLSSRPAPIRLAAIWGELLGLEGIGWDDNYFDLGGDSSLAVQLFARIEQEFGRKLPLATLFDAATINQLAAVLESKEPQHWSPLVCIQPQGTKPPLFLVHDGTGEVLGYRNLAGRLGIERPIYGLSVQAGTRGATVEDLARQYIEAIREAQPDGPYYLAGYCGGGTIAYEMAQQLQKRGRRVGLLALLDTLNWSSLPPRSRWNQLWFQTERLGFVVGNFFRLRGGERWRLFRDKAAALASRFQRVRARGVRQVWNADSAALGAALGRYEPKPYPGHILDVRPMRQHRQFRGEEAKWGRLAQGGQEIVTLPVYAGGLLPDPLVRHLAEALAKALAQADAAVGASLSVAGQRLHAPGL